MPCRNLSFLVVEDHEFQRAMLVQLLKSLGAAAVHTAEDGVAALKVLRDSDRPVDIVISDLAMPGMDGMELVRHLGESGASVALIITSVIERDVLASVASMAVAYKVPLLGSIPKPVTAGKLTPLLDLFRADRRASQDPPANFTLTEITRAWVDDEFEPWFVPIVDLRTWAVRGMEAVPRWEHPQHGVIAAESFLPTVRARRLNDDFVWMMLRKCAARCRQLQDKGHGVPVTVNIAFEALTDVHLAERILQIAQDEGAEPRLMVLSVSESALHTEAARGLENLARLRVAGFGLAINDFGNGPMAAEQLAMVAFTEMKIQGGFVTGSDADESVRAGLAVSLEIAARLRLLTVADGIRSRQEWNLLHEWGCELGQGPFIAEPLRGDAVVPWMDRWSVEHGCATRRRLPPESAWLTGQSRSGTTITPAVRPGLATMGPGVIHEIPPSRSGLRAGNSLDHGAGLGTVDRHRPL